MSVCAWMESCAMVEFSALLVGVDAGRMAGDVTAAASKNKCWWPRACRQTRNHDLRCLTKYQARLLMLSEKFHNSAPRFKEKCSCACRYVFFFFVFVGCISGVLAVGFLRWRLCCMREELVASLMVPIPSLLLSCLKNIIKMLIDPWILLKPIPAYKCWWYNAIFVSLV